MTEAPRTTGTLPIAHHLRPTPGDDPEAWVWVFVCCAAGYGVDVMAPGQARLLPIEGEA